MKSRFCQLRANFSPDVGESARVWLLDASPAGARSSECVENALGKYDNKVMSGRRSRRWALTSVICCVFVTNMVRGTTSSRREQIYYVLKLQAIMCTRNPDVRTLKVTFHCTMRGTRTTQMRRACELARRGTLCPWLACLLRPWYIALSCTSGHSHLRIPGRTSSDSLAAIYLVKSGTIFTSPVKLTVPRDRE